MCISKITKLLINTVWYYFTESIKKYQDFIIFIAWSELEHVYSFGCHLTKNKELWCKGCKA